MSDEFEIRQAQPCDAAILAALAEQTFRETFAASNSIEGMDEHCERSFSESIQLAELLTARARTLIAWQHAQPMGFVQLRFIEPPPCVTDKSSVELQRFYVLRSWHGTGVAGELMRAAFEAAASAPAIWLGVWPANLRAVAFYQKFGFRHVGEKIFHMPNDPQSDWVLARALP